MPKRNRGKSSEREKRDGKSTDRTVKWAPLAGVLVGVSILTVGLACLYLVMRTVGLENEGSCVSGGPYEIAPGHECEDGVFALGYAGAFGLIVGFLIFLWSSHRYGGPLVVTSASGIGWSSLFGGLGGNFLSIGLEMPGSSDGGSEFMTVGIVFLVFALVGLALAFGAVPYSVWSMRLDYPKPTLGAWLAWFAAVAAAVLIGVASFQLVWGLFS